MAEAQGHIGALLLQETHWSFTSEWKQGGWYIHSAAPKPQQGGVLTAIRATLVDEHSLSWQEVIPGRLTQVRCVLGKQQVDLLNLYQHAWSAKTAEQTQDLVRREKLWRQLDGLLGSLPLRSEIILAGDFSAVLGPRMGVAGFGIHRGSQNATFQRDRSLLLDILTYSNSTASQR